MINKASLPGYSSARLRKAMPTRHLGTALHLPTPHAKLDGQISRTGRDRLSSPSTKRRSNALSSGREIPASVVGPPADVPARLPRRARNDISPLLLRGAERLRKTSACAEHL